MKRTQTDPGAPAPPASGSVCPPLPVRPLLRPPVRGAYSVKPADEPEIEWAEETPTKPDGNLQPELLQLVRLVDSMAPVERTRFVRMVENYTRCALGKRVLLEELASELAGVKDRT